MGTPDDPWDVDSSEDDQEPAHNSTTKTTNHADGPTEVSARRSWVESESWEKEKAEPLGGWVDGEV